jgi:hypothetical protein
MIQQAGSPARPVPHPLVTEGAFAPVIETFVNLNAGPIVVESCQENRNINALETRARCV